MESAIGPNPLGSDAALSALAWASQCAKVTARLSPADSRHSHLTSSAFHLFFFRTAPINTDSRGDYYE